MTYNQNMISLLKLINNYFWKGYVGPIFTFILPLVLTLFVGRVVGPSSVVPGVFMLPTLCIFLVFMPQMVFEFKNSSILKRIGSTPIKPYKFLIAIGIYSCLIHISSFIFILASSFGIFYDSLEDTTKPFIPSDIPGLFPDTKVPTFMYMVKHANWVDYIYAQILLIVLSIMIGLFMVSIAKSTLAVQTIGISLLLVTLFVGPCVLPISMVQSVSIVKWLGYLIPLKYPITLSLEAFTSTMKGTISNFDGSNIWDINSPLRAILIYSQSGIDIKNFANPEVILYKTDKVINQLFPWLFIGIFTYLTSCTFTWSNRGKIKFRWNVLSEIIKEKKNSINSKRQFSHDENNKNIIELKNIKKSFKVKGQVINANNDISFDIRRGHNLALLGANGAGKTVLTEIIIGINSPDNGSIKYNFDFNKTYKENIGIQFQDSNYPFGLKCKDIVKFFLSSYDIKMQQDELQRLLDQFGISSFYNKNASSLSGGQQQRLNLLLAIIHKPKIVFLDELSTGLDIKIRNNIKKFIKEYALENNITIVIVSHDMEEVKYLCEDVVVLKNGSINDKTTVKKAIASHGSIENYIEKYL